MLQRLSNVISLKTTIWHWVVRCKRGNMTREGEEAKSVTISKIVKEDPDAVPHRRVKVKEIAKIERVHHILHFELLMY